MRAFFRQLLGFSDEPVAAKQASAEPALPPFDIRRVDAESLKPGDVLVVEMQRQVSMSEVESIRASLKPIFPNNKVVICDEGTKLRVVSAEEADASAEGSEV